MSRTPDADVGDGKKAVILITVRNHAGTMNELTRAIARLDRHLNCRIRVPVYVYVDHGEVGKSVPALHVSTGIQKCA